MLKSRYIHIIFSILLFPYLNAQDSLTTLTITSEPSGARIFINGEIYGNTPNAIQNLTPGNYMIQLEREGYFNWISNYVVSFSSSNSIHAVLPEKTGQIKIDCDINNLPIYLDGKYVGRAPRTLKDIEFGEHVIQVGSTKVYRQDKIYSVFKDTIEVSDTGIKELNIMLASGWLSLTSPQPDLKFSIDESKTGVLPINKLILESGTRQIKLSKEGFESGALNVQIAGGKHHELEYTLMPMTYNKTIYRSAFLPGWGQYYSNNNFKAALFSILEVGTIAGAFIVDSKMDEASKSYKTIYKDYIESVDPEELRKLNRQLKKKYDEIEDHELLRNIFIGLAITNWIVNIVDAHFIGKDLEQFHSENSTSFDASYINSRLEIGLNYNF